MTIKNCLDFLSILKENNNREWFNEHKGIYLEAHGNLIEFADELLSLLHLHDQIETPTGKKSLFRIYRDVRFSKDKTPYQTHFSGGFRRATRHLRGGYYFRIQPGGNSLIAGGFWGPTTEDMKHIRLQIQADDQPLRHILQDQSFQQYFGGLEGEQLKTAPKGFPKDDPAIDLLRYKQLILTHSFSDEEVKDKNFALAVDKGFRNMRPFLDYMSDILTTDLNGTPIP
ncbi:MAG: DUF2461 domain-containing protein [Bacteroidota bacterium]